MATRGAYEVPERVSGKLRYSGEDAETDYESESCDHAEYDDECGDMPDSKDYYELAKHLKLGLTERSLRFITFQRAVARDGVVRDYCEGNSVSERFVIWEDLIERGSQGRTGSEVIEWWRVLRARLHLLHVVEQ